MTSIDDGLSDKGAGDDGLSDKGAGDKSSPWSLVASFSGDELFHPSDTSFWISAEEAPGSFDGFMVLLLERIISS